jgi:D-alanyl-D-alanine carboxypeptidase (penicillin-binding protein 5/6)
MTAYVVLHQHPLRPGAAGPDITITPADVSAFHSDAAKGEAVLAVQSGELLTERQLLEALLVGSAGNAADTLARWDAGTPPAFLAAMNRTAARLGLGATRYADDSGETPGTVSTASNQLTLTMLAMSDPVFAQIVAEPAARFPFAGVMQNFNYDVGRYGVLGVKTGSDAAAGGCWAFAIRRVIVGQPRIVYGVVLGVAPTGAGLIQPALQTGLGLADAMSGTVQHFTLVTAGAPVGYLTAPWRGTHVRLVTAAALSGLASAGATVQLSIQLHQPTGTSIRAGQVLGRLQAQGLLGNASAPIIAADSAAGPSLGWRLAQQPW